MIEKIKTLQIIHLALCAGLIVAYFVIGEISVEKLKTIPTIDSSSIVFAIIPFLAIIMANFLFKSQLKQVDQNLKLEDKLPVYQTASIIRWAILEGVSFIILILKPDFLIFGILVIIYLIFLRPTEEKITNDFSE
jgi:hypothetical protein